MQPGIAREEFLIGALEEVTGLQVYRDEALRLEERRASMFGSVALRIVLHHVLMVSLSITSLVPPW